MSLLHVCQHLQVEYRFHQRTIEQTSRAGHLLCPIVDSPQLWNIAATILVPRNQKELVMRQSWRTRALLLREYDLPSASLSRLPTESICTAKSSMAPRRTREHPRPLREHLTQLFAVGSFDISSNLWATETPKKRDIVWHIITLANLQHNESVWRTCSGYPANFKGHRHNQTAGNMWAPAM